MSEEQKDQKKRIVTELKFPLPDVRVSFDSHFDIISAYVVASNNGKDPVGYKELEPYVKIDSTMVSGCNKFFQHLEIITPSDKIGKYLPTNLAIELHNGRKWKNDELTKSTLRKILDKSWFWIQTRQFLEVNETTGKAELVQKLGLMSGADPDKHTRALDKLIEYMRFAELIKEVDNKISLNISLPSESKDSPTLQSQEQNSDKQSVTPVESHMPVSGLPNITLGIMITSDMTEDQIRKNVRTIIDEIKKIQSEEQE